jgi:DNA-binding CsgD family transcriptional regulator
VVETQVRPPPLLEREAEVERLTAVLDRAVAGEGGLALVEGPAGAGKTSLLRALRARGDEAGASALSATGAELESAFTFGVCRQLFDSPLRGLSGERREQALAGAATHARALFEEEPAVAPPAGSDPLFRVLHGLYWLTAHLSETTPLLLIVDDAQWSDPPSLRFLDYLARRVPELPIALVLALRSGEPETDHEVVEALRSQPDAARVELPPLSEAAVSELVRAQIADAPESLCRACAEATGGNPFYLRELLTHPTGPISRANGAAARLDGLEGAGVDSIARDVVARVARLGPDAAALASAAAVLGDRASLRQVATLAGVDADEAPRAADALAQAAILRLEGDGLRFAHPVARQSVYFDLPPAQRASDHATAASILHDEGASADVVASQLLLGERSGAGWAVAALRAAAADANRQGAPEIAASYLRRALNEPPSPEELPQLLFETGLAEALSANPDAEAHLMQALDRADDPGVRASAASALVVALASVGRTSEAAVLLKRVRDELTEDQPALASWLQGELLVAGVADLRGRELIADELSAARKEAADGTAPPPVLAIVALDALCDSTAEEAAELARRALDGGGMIAALPGEHPAVFLPIVTLIVTDNGPEAESYLQQAADSAAASGSVRAFAAVSILRSRAALRWGRVPEAEAEGRTALRLVADHGFIGSTAVAVAALVDPLIELGKLDEAEAVLETIDPEREDPDAQNFQQWRDSRARLHLERGRPAAALEDMLASGRWERAWGASNSVFSHYPWRSTAALAELALGNREDARGYALEAVEIAEPFGDPHTTGIAHRVAGLAHEGDARLAHLQRAVDTLSGSCSRLEYAKALTDLGTALRQGRRRRDAREPLTIALDLAHRCGATALAERAHEELLATGARPRTPELSGAGALTPSERRVAAMAAEGRSNPEIAQALFVTRKTVEMHLSNAYRKLGVAGREELAGALD